MILLKIAIVGAGLSGLSCAHELKRHGIIPVIYEKGSRIGGKLDFPALVLRMYITPYNDPFVFLKEKYNINIKPYSRIKEMTIISENKVLDVKYDFGFLLARPPFYNAIDFQIAKEADLSVTFNMLADIRELMREFDFVVDASADMSHPRGFGTVSETFHGQTRIANIRGSFKTDSVTFWMNTEYAKQGFAYMVPVSRSDARLVLIVDNISPIALDYYWNKFLETESIKYHITETRDVEHVVGSVDPIRYENLYFTGNIAGMVDSFMGFGSMRAIISGVSAARSIVYGQDYNELMAPIVKDLWKKYEFRKAFNLFTNSSFDRLLTFAGLPLVKQCIFQNPFYKMTMATPLVRLYNKVKYRM